MLGTSCKKIVLQLALQDIGQLTDLGSAALHAGGEGLELDVTRAIDSYQVTAAKGAAMYRRVVQLGAIGRAQVLNVDVRAICRYGEVTPRGG
jgi:hypothetical protein